MRHDEFRHYLLHAYKGGGKLTERTIQSRIANCATLEEHEGDLDALFDRDELKDLLSRLAYSTDDQAFGRQPRHKVPIEGDLHNGSATLKSAANLYKAFRKHPSESACPAPTPPGPDVSKPQKPAQPSTTWPLWRQPQREEALLLARVVARYARFLRPEIVRAIMEDNEVNRVQWSDALKARGIDPGAYLWPKSTCAFPGVRRYAGSSEIAIFRKRASGAVTDALALDDNDYPKQVWSFMLTGKKFPKHGPQGYALAHLADHKVHKNRAGSDFDIIEGVDQTALHGLYTAPTNTAYLPVATIKPTDFGPLLRNLLKRRVEQLYGAFCAPLPPWLSIPAAPDSEWDLDRFEWTEPVGDPQWVPPFLKFRRDMMEKLLKGSTPIAAKS